MHTFRTLFFLHISVCVVFYFTFCQIGAERKKTNGFERGAEFGSYQRNEALANRCQSSKQIYSFKQLTLTYNA